MEASPQMQKYFDEINKKVKEEYKIAAKARSINLDPSSEVEISLAKNMAERVLGLISTVAPQIKDSNLVKVIQDLEKQYGILDWRVAFRISEEVAKQNICKFKSEQEAMEVGIRVGFAYVTVGVVSACLEGFTKLELKKRNDNDQKFFSLYFSGPVRNAGGTAAAVCVLIADYVRRKMGYAQYDPTPEEIKRAVTEVQDYHERVTNLQYYPSRAELEFLLKNMPIEVNGEPTEKIEVSNYKNLPRIKVNLIRGGYALIYSSCIPLKAPKLWKALSKWGKEFEMDQWNFLEEFLKIQKTEKAKATSGDASTSAAKEKAVKIKPDYTYIADLVAGRPVLGYPLAKGAFRLRYGRSRCSGYSGQCLHPASMYVMNKFIAIGTQAKVERPGKGTVLTSCSTIEGPIVKLDTGEVVMVESVAQARLLAPRIKEILFLGDILVNYGDFFNRAHVLVPPGYCEEWWAQELEKAIVDNFGTLDFEKPAKLMDIDKDLIENLVKNPLTAKVSALDAITISKNLNIPLHPRYTYHWKDITKENFYLLLEWLKKANIVSDVNVSKIILPKFEQGKRVLEELGVPHIVATEYVVIEKDDALAFYTQLGNFDLGRFMEIEAEDVLEILNKRNTVKLRDKSGIYIGSRMGRPEKAKMRKLKGSPNGLFPIGEQGGKMRSLQAALEKGFVYSGFANFKCTKCDRTTIYRVCEVCGKETQKILHCDICGDMEKPCEHQHKAHSERKIEIMHYFNGALKILGLDKELFPDMIKGVRGTVNQEHIPEHLAKAVLRAKHGVCVNKDGTVRYDCTELPLTHFKPSEIDVSVEKLKQLGYTKDIHGKELENDEQILELKPQDVVIPCCPDIDEPCDKFLLQTTAFIDELLEKFYGQKKYYNCATRQDLVGHLMIGLAPHTSAGSVARIIGFSKNQGLMAHPVFHAALRRDCDGDEAGVFLLLDGLLNFSRKYLPGTRGATMDAPIVLTSIVNPAEVDDMVFDMDVSWKYPLDFYKACMEYKMPWEVKIEQVKERLEKPEQYEGYGFTHDNGDMNDGVRISSYKTLPTMMDKLDSQLDLAEKIRAVDAANVAALVINKHFIKDLKGNLRKFSQQEFRCVNCNKKYRRPPLIGRCVSCNGKIIFTISEGSVIKYLGPSLALAEKYNLPAYLKQTLQLTTARIESVFGKDKEKQEGLGKWFASG